MKKISLLLALVIVMSCCLVACGGKNYKAVPIDPNYVSSKLNDPNQSISGLDGIRVSVPKEVNSIVCFSPESAMIFGAIGAGAKVRGVDEVTAKAYEGANAKVVTLENINTVSPDVVFITEDYDVTALTDAGIPCFVVPKELTINNINTLIRIAEKIHPTKSDSLTTNIDKAISYASATTGLISKGRAVFLDLGSLKTSGKGTYINEIIEKAGGENVFADKSGYIEVTAAELLEANPEYIFTVNLATYNNAAYKELNAVKNKKVIQIDKNGVIYGTHNIANAINFMVDQMYDSNTSGN